jgi:hypothetical protein
MDWLLADASSHWVIDPAVAIASAITLVSGLVGWLSYMAYAAGRQVKATESLEGMVKSHLKENKEEHHRICNRLDVHEGRLSRHDTRLGVVEDRLRGHGK